MAAYGGGEWREEARLQDNCKEKRVPSIILERSEGSGFELGRKSWSGERRKVAQRNVGALDDDTLPV